MTENNAKPSHPDDGIDWVALQEEARAHERLVDLTFRREPLQAGDRVEITTGAWAPRRGVVTGITGRAHTVRFTGPKFIAEPDGAQEEKLLPYAREELTLISRAGRPETSD